MGTRVERGTMSAVKAPPLLVLAIVALLLYWVVQDPVGAAAMIREVFDWTLGFLQLVAERIVQFLSALT
jgi:cell shape-determining protein MreC